MLINKAMLAGALEVCRTDKEFPILNTVLIDTDGTICAMNKMVLYAAEPVLKSVSERVPLPAKDMLRDRIVLSSEMATELLKMIPTDKVFKGLLEHASVDFADSTGSELNIVIKDGQHTKSVKMHALNVQWPDWKKVFVETKKHVSAAQNFVYNRKRLEASVAAVRASCNYQGDFAAIFSEYSCVNGGNRMLWKCVNELTGQTVVIVSNLAEIQQVNNVVGTWEKSLYQNKLKLVRKSHI